MRSLTTTLCLFLLTSCSETAPPVSAVPSPDVEVAAPTVVLPTLPSRYGVPTSARWAIGGKWVRRDLTVVANPNPNPEPQPHRDHPQGMALSGDGGKLYVALPGTEAEPGNEVAVVRVAAGDTRPRIRVGSRPWSITMHPGGRFALVTNLYSNYVSVIDTRTDRVVSEIPADFYCHTAWISRDGARAYLSNRYLGQLLVAQLSLEDDVLKGEVVPRGGFDGASFANADPGTPAEVLRRRCGGAYCHGSERSGFYAGPNGPRALASAAANSVAGRPDESLLLRAVLPVSDAGIADDRTIPNNHNGGRAVLRPDDPDYAVLADWIATARIGPGIPIGNPGSRPAAMAADAEERFLYVANYGVPDVGVVDLEKGEEVSAIHVQNLPLSTSTWHDPATGAQRLFILSGGLGFGAPSERDPYGGETVDRDHPVAQFSVLRDPATAKLLPLKRQRVLGPFEAVDGTAAFKMRDIQNDITAVDLRRLRVPEGGPDYALLANRYEAHDSWVRYTSDSAEAMANDIRGDIPPDLMRVVGAQPMAAATAGDSLYVVSYGTFELVRYRIDAGAREPSDLLTPVAVYETGLGPRDVVVGRSGTAADGLVFVSNSLGETVTVVALATGATTEIVVGDLSLPVPATNAERGELFVHTSIFSVDQDTACLSCHPFDSGDGRSWGAGQVIGQLRDGQMVSGGLLAIPQMRGLFPIQPFYFEGTHTCFDGQFDDAREHVAAIDFVQALPGGDLTSLTHPVAPDERRIMHEELQEKVSVHDEGKRAWDLDERRDEWMRRQTMRYFGKAFVFSDFQRFIGEFQAAEARLLPNPYDQNNEAVLRGRALFNGTATGCGTCHPPPSFASKAQSLTHNREATLPSLVTMTRRDGTYTLMSPSFTDRLNGRTPDVQPWEEGRVEQEEGRFTTFQLRGLFDRPRSLLHHGRAISLREVLCTPDHEALGVFKFAPLRGGERIRPGGREKGFNETRRRGEGRYIVDTHGGTSHLNAHEIQDLVAMLLAIE